MTVPAPTFEHTPAMRAWDGLRRPIWLFDPVGLRGVYANDAALILWGAQSREELLARDFSQLSPAVLARTERLARATAGGETVDEQWTFYPQGAPVTVQATISTYRLDDGRPVLLFEAAPAEVKAGERRAVEALRHTSTLITLFDSDGAAIFANPAAFAAYDAAEHPFLARFIDSARGEALFAQASGGAIAADLCEVMTARGRRWHQFDARPVLDPVTGAPGVLLNEKDVTLRVEAEVARAAAEQKAAMAEARQKFLTDMSHELRTPLNAVIGFAGLLRDSGLDEARAGQAARIHAAGERLNLVVERMIAMDDLAALPTPPPEPDAVSSAPQANPDGGDDDTPLRVLYVDDNEANRALVCAILCAQGIECDTADDGAQGLEAARLGGWDVILMDIQMPVMNGMEATRAIRRLPGQAGCVPIVAVTANTLSEQLADYEEAGLDDCIAKPVGMAELISKTLAWGEASREAARGDGDGGMLAAAS